MLRLKGSLKIFNLKTRPYVYPKLYIFWKSKGLWDYAIVQLVIKFFPKSQILEKFRQTSSIKNFANNFSLNSDIFDICNFTILLYKPVWTGCQTLKNILSFCVGISAKPINLCKFGRRKVDKWNWNVRLVRDVKL